MNDKSNTFSIPMPLAIGLSVGIVSYSILFFLQKKKLIVDGYLPLAVGGSLGLLSFGITSLIGKKVTEEFENQRKINQALHIALQQKQVEVKQTESRVENCKTEAKKAVEDYVIKDLGFDKTYSEIVLNQIFSKLKI